MLIDKYFSYTYIEEGSLFHYLRGGGGGGGGGVDNVYSLYIKP